jgi:hypothetical protein
MKNIQRNKSLSLFLNLNGNWVVFALGLVITSLLFFTQGTAWAQSKGLPLPVSGLPGDAPKTKCAAMSETSCKARVMDARTFWCDATSQEYIPCPETGGVCGGYVSGFYCPPSSPTVERCKPYPFRRLCKEVPDLCMCVCMLDGEELVTSDSIGPAECSYTKNFEGIECKGLTAADVEEMVKQRGIDSLVEEALTQPKTVGTKVGKFVCSKYTPPIKPPVRANVSE